MNEKNWKLKDSGEPRSVWYCIPSARSVQEAADCLLAWHRKGYGIAILRDQDDELTRLVSAHGGEAMVAPYEGWGAANNRLARQVLAKFPHVDWCVFGGDDCWPDPVASPETVRDKLNELFEGTFGVMQPTGDPFANHIIRRIAGSPWCGREWCRRAYGGTGPMDARFFHNFGDEALQRVATGYDRFTQFEWMCQEHRHAQRTGDDFDLSKPFPHHLTYACSEEEWYAAEALFHKLVAEDFADCVPLGLTLADWSFDYRDKNERSPPDVLRFRPRQ